MPKRRTYRHTPSMRDHHIEWLSLLDVSGPFLSLPVLLDVFPQGLPPVESDIRGELRVAYDEWLDNKDSLRHDQAIHKVWVEWVLRRPLGMLAEVLERDTEALAKWSLDVPEQGERVTPALAVVDPDSRDKARMLVLIVDPGQSLEGQMAGSHWAASPATRMMELLHAKEVRLGLVTNGEQWMLVHAPRGQAAGYISWYSELWLDEPNTLRAFSALLNVQRFFGVPDDETLEALFDRSEDEQQEVTTQIGDQVREALSILVQAIDRADLDRGGRLLRDVDEARLYEAAVTIMMRLIFLLAAEERGLLLLGDPLYDDNYAISTMREQLHERADQLGEEVLERRHDAWCRLLATFRAVYAGVTHDRMTLRAYGGGLFDPDRYAFLEGREAGTAWDRTPAEPLPIDNRTVLHLLDALQMLGVRGQSGREARRLSFRALDIEQIGHVYEGLLDHTALRATEPVLGLQRAKDQVADLSLAELDAERAKGEKPFLTYLRKQTGRSTSALKRRWWQRSSRSQKAGSGRRAATTRRSISVCCPMPG